MTEVTEMREVTEETVIREDVRTDSGATEEMEETAAVCRATEMTEIRGAQEDQATGETTETDGLQFPHRLWRDRNHSAARGRGRMIIRRRISAVMMKE